MAREKITFEPGQPVQVQLDKSDSKPIEGRNGTDYMRVCDRDQRIMFCPEALELAITESGAAAGDVIEIRTTGKGKNLRYSVGIVGQPQPAAARPHSPRASSTAAAVDAALMADAYAAAILATGQAEEHAVRAGVRDLHLTDADTITRVALTIFIQRSKETL